MTGSGQMIVGSAEVIKTMASFLSIGEGTIRGRGKVEPQMLE